MTWKPGDRDRRQDHHDRPNGDLAVIHERFDSMRDMFNVQFAALDEKVDAMKTVPQRTKTGTWAMLATAAIAGVSALGVAYIGAHQLPAIQANTDGRLSEMITELGKMREDNSELREIIRQQGGPRDPLKDM